MLQKFSRTEFIILQSTMKIGIYETTFQFAITPSIRVTYSKELNGEFELIFGWLHLELVISTGI